MKYEVEPVYFGRNFGHHTIIGILTGLSLEEIIKVTPVRDIWYTRDFIHAFHSLGFNTNPRFIKFDTETFYPCIMRCQDKPDSGYWHGWVYYDQMIYDAWGQKFSFDDWIDVFKDRYRVTSMLQVWI